MKKLRSLIGILIWLILPLLFPKVAIAISNCNGGNFKLALLDLKPREYREGVDQQLVVKVGGFVSNESFQIISKPDNSSVFFSIKSGQADGAGVGTIIFTNNETVATHRVSDELLFPNVTRILEVNFPGPGEKCTLGRYQILAPPTSCTSSVSFEPVFNPQCVDENTKFRIKISNVIVGGRLFTGDGVLVGESIWQTYGAVNINNGSVAETIAGPFERIGRGRTPTLYLHKRVSLGEMEIGNDVGEKICVVAESIDMARSCANRPTGPEAPGGILKPYDPGCTEGETENVKTALGCLPTDPETFVNKALPWAIGIGAGIAFLLGIAGAAMISLSAGNPEKMQAGKEMITSAIAGLLLIIFAMFILRVVGVDILKLFLFEEPGHPGGGGT